MIELLGVGVHDRRRGWQLRQVTATFDTGTLVAVTASPTDDTQALLDAVSGRRIPNEGRVWIDRLPLMRETASRVRRRIAHIDGTQERPRLVRRALGLIGRRDALRTAMSHTDRLLSECARALRRSRTGIVIRHAVEARRPESAAPLFEKLRAMARFRRITIVVAADPAMPLHIADRVVRLSHGHLVEQGSTGARCMERA